MALTITSSVALNNGGRMPLFGFGTWQLEEGPQAREMTGYALEVGYRLLDTAAAYGNERSVGQAVRESGIDRGEIFLTTKVQESEQGYDQTLRAFERSLARLGTEYIDLYLIHWPVPGRSPDTWRAMVTLLDGGRCRAIGVSNFEIAELEELRAITPEILPAVNQVPYSPYQQQRELFAYCRDHGIAFEGYSPLRRINLHDPALTRIAGKYGKTPAQILLRWPLQHGAITIPKSAHKSRIRENADIFDFEIDADDMAAIDGMG